MRINKLIIGLLNFIVFVAIISSLSFCTQPSNRPPVIQSLIIPHEMPASFEVKMFCKAVDHDGDSIKIQWFSDNGTFKGEGNNVIWVSPDIPGDYDVGVKVTDIKGHEAVSTVKVKVTTLYKTDIDPNPIIAMQMPLFYSEMISDQRRVRPMTTSEIECMVPLNFLNKHKYTWYCNGGKLIGEGIKDGKASRIGWVSPGVPGNYTVTVEVTNNDGYLTLGSTYFEVRLPACCEGTCNIDDLVK